MFTVTGASLGTTCTATETVPVGYTANQANCVGVALNGSCTIINTLNGVVTITVNKDFIPNSVATVPVALTCTSGTVTTTPLNAAEGCARGVPGDRRQCGGDLHRNRDGAAGLHREPGQLPRRRAQRQLHHHQYAQQCIDHGEQELRPDQCRDGAGGAELYVRYRDHHAVERGRRCARGVPGERRQCGGDLHRNRDGAAGLHREPGQLPRRGAQRQLHHHQYAQQRIDHGEQEDFVPTSAATVPVALTPVPSGTVSTTPLNAAEGAPAVFQVSGASAGAAPAPQRDDGASWATRRTRRVTASASRSTAVAPSPIRPNSASITVNKNFVPTSAATVPVALSCTSGYREHHAAERGRGGAGRCFR